MEIPFVISVIHWSGAAAFFLVKDEFGSGQPSAIFRRSLRIVKKDKEVLLLSTCDMLSECSYLMHRDRVNTIRLLQKFIL